MKGSVSWKDDTLLFVIQEKSFTGSVCKMRVFIIVHLNFLVYSIKNNKTQGDSTVWNNFINWLTRSTA